LPGVTEDRKQLEATIFARIVAAVPPLDEGTVTPATNLRRDLGLDSLGLASFLFRCGEALDLDENDLIEALAGAPLQTVGDVVALCAGLPSGASGGGARA
jgi:acyl carrier protein